MRAQRNLYHHIKSSNTGLSSRDERVKTRDLNKRFKNKMCYKILEDEM